MNRPRKKSKKKISSLKLFVLFTIVALATVVTLEYIDFKKNKNSFIFTKLNPLERTEDKIDRFNKRLIEILNVNKIPYDSFSDDENKYHFRMDIDENRSERLIGKITGVTDRLKVTLELTEIQGFANKTIMLYKVRMDGNVTHLLLITKLKPVSKTVRQPAPRQEEPRRPPVEKQKPAKSESAVPTEKPAEQTGYGPRIAFIIDDMGAYDVGAAELKQLEVPVTASVLADSRRGEQTAQELRENDIDMLIHLPMQPTNSNGKTYNPGNVITMRSTDDEIRDLIRRAKKIVPAARGVNNHEGSLVTADIDMMIRVLGIIKEEGLFFVDSRTIARTVAYDVAKELNVKTAHKDVFLDHVQGYSHSIEQVRILVEIAKQNGKAIAIGHPFETTFRAIRDSRQYIESQGVRIVLVEDLLE